MKKIIFYLSVIGLLLMNNGCLSAENIKIENDYFRYEIAQDGKNIHFIDKASGIDYLFAGEVSYCASIGLDGKQINATSVSMKDDRVYIEFGKSAIAAEIHIVKAGNYIKMEVVKITGKPESLTFLNIPLKLEGLPSEPFAACALSMNLFTRVKQLPALQTHLWAGCYSRFGIEGASVSVIGVPQKEILPVIRQIMKKAKDIPLSTTGGAWAQLQKEGYGSYLMQFGSLTEKTVDDWIKTCKEMGFNQIDNHGGTRDFFTFGDFKLNPGKWPDGWESFRRINDRLHQAGISSIFHTYAFFIDKESKYVKPVPSPDLDYSDSFTLTRPLGPDDTEITVNESTAHISIITGFATANSVTLHIGDELITFKGVTSSAPFKFTGCKRGANGTEKSVHAVGEKVFHLKEMFGRFVPGHETALFNEIARNTADVVNEGHFDGIYLDAIDGSSILDGGENAWYYGTRFIFEIARHLKHSVGMEMSAMEPLWWHYRTRWQAWDKPTRGYKRFIDIHTASIKSQENEHGHYPGQKELIDKYAPLENGRLLLPLHLGWWQYHVAAPPQIEATFTDDVEYLGCKMIGNNAGLSMLMTDGIDQKKLDENPVFRRLNAIMKQYEDLRHSNYFGDSVKALLRQPGKEFTLFKEESGKWNFKPVTYQKHKVEGADPASAKWTVNNTFDKQPVRLRIELLMSVKPYNSPEGVVLSDFTAPDEFLNKANAVNISGKILKSAEKTVNGENAGSFSGLNSGISPGKASWTQMEKKFDPILNIEKNQALGVWIKGDGKGELLNFREESPEYISFGARGDHYVKIDFTGWKYVELVEIESTEFTNYFWPNENDTYSTFRTTVDFKNIDKLQLWYNNIPEGKKVNCLIGPVKALPMVNSTIENPSVVVDGKKITFPVSMESGMYIEFNSANDCKLYSPKGKLIKEISIDGEIPVLKTGENEIFFLCKEAQNINTRAQVTVISEGKPLKNK